MEVRDQEYMEMRKRERQEGREKKEIELEEIQGRRYEQRARGK